MAKAQCNVTHSADDSLLSGTSAEPGLIERATRWCEDYTQRAFITQTWRLTMDGFLDPRYVHDRVIYVPRPPLIAVSSLTYFDTANTSQTLTENTHFLVDADHDPGRIGEYPDQTWPATEVRVKAVTVTHTAGYGAATSVPEDIRHAILMLVAHWYRNREAAGSIAKEIEFALTSILAPYKMECYA